VPDGPLAAPRVTLRPMGEGSYGTPGRVDTEVETVRAIFEAFAARDVERAVEFLAEDVELWLPGTASRAGRTNPYRGHDGVRAYVADMSRVWGELSLHADDIRASTGGVVVFGHVRGRVDDQPVQRRVMWTWKLRGTLASSVRVTDLA
jgi:ketosteroid isomerase-like protein